MARRRKIAVIVTVRDGMMVEEYHYSSIQSAVRDLNLSASDRVRIIYGLQSEEFVKLERWGKVYAIRKAETRLSDDGQDYEDGECLSVRPAEEVK